MNEVLHGNSYELVKQLDANSVDLICTDPPYGIKFMGKHWDRAVPPVEFWADCLQVLKPGAFAFVMSLPRQDCLARMIINLENAGFVMAFTSIYWTFASGFPKAMSISKAVDKQAGAERENLGRSIRLGDKKSYSYTRREGTWKGNTGLNDIGFVTKPATLQAQALDGAYAGFQPKPAVEIILVAMKPLDCDTYVEQALTNGKGVTWLDDGRIPFNKIRELNIRNNESRGGQATKFQGVYNAGKIGGELGRGATLQNSQGRFPANLLVSDDVLNDGINYKTGNLWNHSQDTSFFIGLKEQSRFHVADSGSYSRYFDLDAWFGERLNLLPEQVRKTFPWLIVPKPAKSEKTANGQIDNKHPTVKPLKLMSYLLTIGSRPGEVVLDPFSGSGTTSVACQMWNRRFIAIEQELEFVELAQARLRACRHRQPSLFCVN